MTRTRNTFLALVAVLLSPMAANADLIDAGSTTIDTDTGLEWLDVLETVGLSYNAVLASSYVLVDGYRFATGDEVLALWANAGGVAVPGNILANLPATDLLLDLMGCTSFIIGNDCDGVAEDWHAAMWGDGSFIALVDSDRRNPPLGHLRLDTWVTNPDVNVSWRADVGSYVVRSAAVPEPGTLALLGIGLFGMGLARRRRKV